MMSSVFNSKLCAALFTAFILQAPIAMAQSAQVTTNVLFRVLMVRSQVDRGTIFSIDVDQREYWITAKHILTGAQHPPFGSIAEKSVTLSVLDPDASQEKWLPETFSVIDPGKDIDIVVLAPATPILKAPIPSLPAESVGASFGGDCEFLGYPTRIGGAWRIKVSGSQYWMPFIKHCTISGKFVEPMDYWVLDGINNGGFSGGPVVFLTGPAQKIMAVISGYQTEPADVSPAIPMNGSAAG
jgi:hypothetical protein